MDQQTQSPTTASGRGDRQPEMQASCEGGCACGAVRYRVTSAPMIVHACHCSLCQRQTGSTNAVNALIEADRVFVRSGEIEEILLDTPSGRGQRVARCASCKIALWSNYLSAERGDYLRFLRVGSLDDPSLMPPDVHIFTSTIQPWYVIGDGKPAFQEYYHRKTTWSRDSLQRLEELAEKTATPLNSRGETPGGPDHRDRKGNGYVA